MCHPTCESDVAALANRSSRTLCPVSTGADEAGMQNSASKSDLRSGYWSQSVDNGSRDDTAYSDHCLALRDVSGFRKLFQNRNITTTRILNGFD